ncbi:DEAD/DEAH box helicase [Mesoplasma photuris]|uniref:DEAD/DEAH box helicase n=1 Tax=Mesoplasma photuris TaxID=217731 RepID=UPI00068DDBF8|nr:DEAD/DEAH box helicase [Mesoplasma photuris]
MKFNELNLHEDILKALEKNKFNEPTEIQIKAIPVFLEGKDLFGKSSTGTGKTAAFVLPILSQLKLNLRKPQAIIMAPTRELALQIMDQVKMFSSKMKHINVVPIIGGAPMQNQINRLRDAQIIVGTPGRINDHINRKTIWLEDVRTVILDEADEMLKMGFRNEIDAVFEGVDPTGQVGLFSATNNAKVMQIADRYLKDPVVVEIDNVIEVNNNIENTFVFTKGFDKNELLLAVFEKHEPKRSIIFSNTKSMTDKIAKVLRDAGIKAVVINGDKKQSQRSRAIQQFKNNEYQVLVATDVVARGIDITGIDYVINYDISIEDEHFVHRIGRTGRNGTTGSSISFIPNIPTINQMKSIQTKYKIVVTEIDAAEYGVEKKKKEASGQSSNKMGNNGNFRSSRSKNDSGRGGSRNGRNDRNSSKSSKSGSKNGSNGYGRGKSSDGSKPKQGNNFKSSDQKRSNGKKKSNSDTRIKW